MDLNNIPDLEGWMTVPEAAEYLGISRSRFDQLVRADKITSVHKVGGRFRIVRQQEMDDVKPTLRSARSHATVEVA